MYRIPESTEPGILKSQAQYDRCTRKVQISRQYRNELLESLSKELKTSKQEGVLDFLVVGDFNQDIEGEKMKIFMRENGLFDIHSTMNPNNDRDRDNTYKTGSKQINAVMSTPDLLDSIQGSKLVDYESNVWWLA